MNAALTAAMNALATVGKPTYLGMFLDTDADGLLVLPTDATFIVLHAISAAAEYEWRNYTFDTVRIQVNAYSRIEGAADALLTAAKPLLVAARFTPRNTRTLGREGAYTAVAQDWEVNA